MHLRLPALILVALPLARFLPAADLVITHDPTVAPLRFAAAEIRAAAQSRPAPDPRITLALSGAPIPGWPDAPKPTAPQGYALRVRQLPVSSLARTPAAREFLIVGADVTGAMYGGLDLADAIRTGTLADLADADRAPYLASRGIKFNLPLDARTPSYSDFGDSGQANIPEVWEMKFWRDYLDEMARQRLNTLSLWNLSPFPSMVRVPEYPDLALADVKRTTFPFDETMDLQAKNVWDPVTMGGDKLETVKKMTIEQKMEFWRAVMDYAHERGVAVYLFTWNLYTYGVDGARGITADWNNPETKKYVRASARALLLAYPRLAGLGVTVGEGGLNRAPGNPGKEIQWLYDTYGQAVNDVHALFPDRPLRVIHRLHWTNLATIKSKWAGLKVPLDLSYKYSRARMHSSPAPTFYTREINSLPAGQRIWLTVRNDDFYFFRWGDPDYVRDYIRAIPDPVARTSGFYIGPDGFTLGRDFLTKTDDAAPRPLIIEKNWYEQNLFGRLAYDPATPNAHFERLVGARFPGAPASKLSAGWTAASRIVPLVNRLFFNVDDFPFYPEGCIGRNPEAQFISITDLISYPVSYDPKNGLPMGGEGGAMSGGLRSIRGDNGESALKVATELETFARTARTEIAAIAPGAQRELAHTLGDIRAMAALGDYYASKFRGAVAFHRKDSAAAMRETTTALARWKTYAAAYSAQYHGQMTVRQGPFDPVACTVWAAHDIALANPARGLPPSVVKRPTPERIEPVLGGTTTLTVLGQDPDDPESALTYTWTVIATAPAPVVFSANGTNAAKRITATFTRPGHYMMEVLIQDPNYNVTRTRPLTIYVPEVGARPTVNLPAPAGVFRADANVWLHALARDAQGAPVRKVEFYDGDTLINTQADDPRSFVRRFTAGEHVITAKATDLAGRTATSVPLLLKILAADASPTPVVELTSGKGGKLAAGAALSLSATVIGAAPGTAPRVEFWCLGDDGLLLGTSTAAPHVFVWNNVPPGAYDITARLVAADGTVTFSTLIGKYSVASKP